MKREGCGNEDLNDTIAKIIQVSDCYDHRHLHLKESERGVGAETTGRLHWKTHYDSSRNWHMKCMRVPKHSDAQRNHDC